MIMGSSAIGPTAPSIPSFLQAAASAQQVLKLTDENAATGKNGDQGLKLKPGDVRGQLEPANVVFSHPERPTVSILNNLSLDIPGGLRQRSVIVGVGKALLLTCWRDGIVRPVDQSPLMEQISRNMILTG
jgi:hypothetical protein